MTDIALTVQSGPTVELTADAPGAVTVTVSSGGGVSTHAGLPDLATSGHPVSVITGALSAATAATTYQPLDSDLTAIAALSTTSYGRALLALADAAAGRTALGLGGAATLAVGTTAGTVAAGDDSRITGAVAKSLVDAAGDLIYATAADTVARLPLGTASQVLTVNSGATAPEWAAASGGAAGGGPTFASGWYAGWSGAPATIGSTEDRAHYVPIPVPRSLTIDRIGIEVTSSATGSPTVRLGVYADANGVPGALILDAGTVDASTTGFKEITISQALTAGLVWLACAQQGGTSTGVLRGMTGSTHVGIPAGFSQYAVAAFYASGVTDALAASAPTMESAVGTAPRIMLRVV